MSVIKYSPDDVSKLSERIWRMEQDLKNLKVERKIEQTTGFGNVNNMILNSSFIDSDSDNLPDFCTLMLTPTLVIASDTLFPSRGGNQITITNTGGDFEGIYLAKGGTTNWLKVLPSTYYVFSIDYKNIVGAYCGITLRSYNGDTGGDRLNLNLFSTSAIKISQLYKTDDNADNLAISLWINTDTYSAIFSHPKLEQGKILTPYILNKYQERINVGIYSDLTWDQAKALSN